MKKTPEVNDLTDYALFLLLATLVTIAAFWDVILRLAGPKG